MREDDFKGSVHRPNVAFQQINARLSELEQGKGGGGGTGSTGYTGYTGPTSGPTGYTGPIGRTGYTGPTGYTGLAGAATATGATGPTGYTGTAGTASTTGATGYTGTIGPTGYTGYTGTGAFTGPTGFTGATGYTGGGTTGTTGYTGYTGYTGSGGGGGGSLSGAFASLPGTCSVGDLYFTTDSIYTVARCTTTNVWSWFLDGYQVTPPAATGTWVNQNSATVSAVNGGIYIADPAATPDAENYKAYVYPAPGATFTLTAILHPNLINANFANGGICLRESGSGKGLIFHLFSEGGSYHLVATYLSSFASGASQVAIFDTGWTLDQPVPLVLQIVVGATDITFYSTSQHNPIQPMQLLGTIPKTTAFTVAPDQHGISINARHATNNAGIWCASLAAA